MRYSVSVSEWKLPHSAEKLELDEIVKSRSKIINCSSRCLKFLYTYYHKKKMFIQQNTYFFLLHTQMRQEIQRQSLKQ